MKTSCAVFILALAIFFPSEVVIGIIDPFSIAFRIRWVRHYTDDVYMLSFDPAGVQNYFRTFLCRGQNSLGNYIAGYLWVKGDKPIVCRMPNNGEVVEAEVYEVLQAPQGTVSWVPMPTNGSVPRGCIGSGYSDTDRKQYVCRAADANGNIVPGKYAPYNRRCYIGVEGKEVRAKTGEILVVNAFGFAAEVDNDTAQDPEESKVTGGDGDGNNRTTSKPQSGGENPSSGTGRKVAKESPSVEKTIKDKRSESEIPQKSLKK